MAANRGRFKGDILNALKLLRPLIEGVVVLHKNGFVHRDIKPKNIFISDTNQLILGDFGIVYFEDAQHTRITDSFENVGSHSWMPSWAQTRRIEEVNPNFDVFSLGKVLWCMISGIPTLSLWYFRDDSYNLKKLFPNNKHMNLANELFAKFIVEREEQCKIGDAKELLSEIDQLISLLQHNAALLGLDIERHCQVCGRGKYQSLTARYQDPDHSLPDNQHLGIDPINSRRYLIFACKNCGHVQLFYYTRDTLPPAWRNN